MARLTKSSIPLGRRPGGRAGCGEAWGLAAGSLPPPVTPTLDALSRQHGIDSGTPPGGRLGRGPQPGRATLGVVMR